MLIIRLDFSEAGTVYQCIELTDSVCLVEPSISREELSQDKETLSFV